MSPKTALRAQRPVVESNSFSNSENSTAVEFQWKISHLSWAVYRRSCYFLVLCATQSLLETVSNVKRPYRKEQQTNTTWFMHIDSIPWNSTEIYQFLLFNKPRAVSFHYLSSLFSEILSNQYTFEINNRFLRKWEELWTLYYTWHVLSYIIFFGGGEGNLQRDTR